MSFDPIASSRTQRFTKQELKDFWQGPGRIVQRTKEENPALYAELHIAGEQAGILGKSLAQTPQPYVKNYKPAPKQYSANELAARGRRTEAEVRAFFADAKKANDLFHSDRNEYERMRESGVSYGLFEPRVIPYQPTKPAEPAWTMRISDELATESNLPIGTVVNSAQLEQLCQQRVDRARKVEADAAAKLEADRLAEIAKLSARQQADQAERDRKLADLQRLEQLIQPQPVVTQEPTALATARLVAAERAKSVETPTA
jgi:hypothetical protein